MVLCFIALPIFLILGIFSVRYRILAKDALECLGKTITFRRCKSSLDERIKAHLTGRIIKTSPKLGMFIYKRFQLLSIIFIILIISSLFISVWGLVNYIKYGNCYGPNNNDYFCPYATIFGDKSSEIADEKCECNESERYYEKGIYKCLNK